MRRQQRKGGGQQIEVSIAALGARGDGLARLADDTPLYIPYALPGERAVVRTAARTAAGVRGDVIELLEISPDRVETPCANTALCGGCTLAHWHPKAQAAWKQGQAKAAVTRAGFDAAHVAPLIQPEDSLRRRARFAVEGGKVGFRQRHSKAIAAYGPCLSLNPGLAQFWHAAQGLRPDLSSGLSSALPPSEWLVTDLPAGLDISIEAKMEAPDPMTLERWRAVLPPFARLSWNGQQLLEIRPPHVDLGSLAPVLPIGGFLQPSLGGQRVLQDLVLDALPRKAEWVADLYCGIGTFAIPLAARGHRVQALESFEPAVAALDAAVRRDPDNTHRLHTGLRNLDLYPLSKQELAGFDAVVFDPPRSGARAQAKHLAASQVKTVVAISCNPATWARDAALLREGGYTLKSLTPIDQFPNTAHLELISVFTR